MSSPTFTLEEPAAAAAGVHSEMRIWHQQTAIRSSVSYKNDLYETTKVAMQHCLHSYCIIPDAHCGNSLGTG
jgi:hypothetical protein